MNIFLTANLSSRTITDGSSTWVPPVMVFGEELTLSVHLQRNQAGAAVDYYPILNWFKAAIGNIDAPPTGGKFQLKIGAAVQSSANTTAALQFNATASEWQSAINALSGIVATYGTASVWQSGGSFYVRFGGGSVQVPMLVVGNQLWPLSFGRVTASMLNNQWIQEIRMVQAPVAFTDVSTLMVPPAPTIRYVQHGESVGSVLPINTIMSLWVPTNFAGTYQIVLGSIPSGLLTAADGIAEITTALAIFGDGITVTNPNNGFALIEWAGSYTGTDVALPSIVVSNAPQGDLEFTLQFNTAELAAMLDRSPEVTLPFEVRINITDPSEDNVAHELVAFTVAITIKKPVIWPQLETMPNVDWLRPLSPVDYTPFDPSQVITGQQYYQAVVGDGSATIFDVTHGLATRTIFVWVRENKDHGKQLVQGTDFSVQIEDGASVSVTALTGAPAANAWVIFVMSAQTVAAFAAGLTIGMGQVTGLAATLAGMASAISTLQTLLPANAKLPSSASGNIQFQIPILPSASVLFLPSNVTLPTGTQDPSAVLPKRAAFMLPAVHTATVTNTSTAPTPAAGTVWTNNSGADLLIPGGGGIRSGTVAAAGKIASDGRIVYPATRSGTSISYYPTPFEQTLWNMFINDKMFPAGTICTVMFGLALQLVNASCEAQYVVVIEKGVAARDIVGSPDTTDTNLQAITWDLANPILRQQVILTPALITHTFGCAIANNTTGLTANALIYNQIVAANAAAPSSGNFALRARLIEFDTEDSATNARGWVSIAIVQPGGTGNTLGAIIA